MLPGFPHPNFSSDIGQRGLFKTHREPSRREQVIRVAGREEVLELLELETMILLVDLR